MRRHVWLIVGLEDRRPGNEASFSPGARRHVSEATALFDWAKPPNARRCRVDQPPIPEGRQVKLVWSLPGFCEQATSGT
jgi:hypothetical protein